MLDVLEPLDAGADDARAEGAAEELVVGCDVASTAVVAASTRTAAKPTAVMRPTTAGGQAQGRPALGDPFLEMPHCVPPRDLFGASINPRCQGG